MDELPIVMLSSLLYISILKLVPENPRSSGVGRRFIVCGGLGEIMDKCKLFLTKEVCFLCDWKQCLLDGNGEFELETALFVRAEVRSTPWSSLSPCP
jgi:hypothetical protein